MAKRHRPPTSEPRTRTEDKAPEQVLDHGNQAASERIASSADPARTLADGAAQALRFAPRDPAWTARLTEIVARSDLPAERRELVTLRLEADQTTADEVSAAVQTWLGRDGPELRASLIDALDTVTVGTPEDRVAPIAAERAGVPVEAVRGLCRDLVLLVAFVWDEDEAWAPAGDYLAEESGT